jgi:hypothetical protein
VFGGTAVLLLAASAGAGPGQGLTRLSPPARCSRGLRPVAPEGLRPVAPEGLRPVAPEGLRPVAPEGRQRVAVDPPDGPRVLGPGAERAVEAVRRRRSSRAPTTRSGVARARRRRRPVLQQRPARAPCRGPRPDEQVLQPQARPALPGREGDVPQGEAHDLAPSRPRDVASPRVVEQRASSIGSVASTASALLVRRQLATHCSEQHEDRRLAVLTDLTALAPRERPARPSLAPSGPAAGGRSARPGRPTAGRRSPCPWSPRRSWRSRRCRRAASGPRPGSMFCFAPVPLACLIVLLISDVEVGVLLEVRRLEVVAPEHPQVLLHELRALVDDPDGAAAEDRVLVGLVLLLHREHRLGLDAGLRGVVDAARQVAVRRDDGRRGEEAGEPHACPSRSLRFSGGACPCRRPYAWELPGRTREVACAARCRPSSSKGRRCCRPCGP